MRDKVTKNREFVQVSRRKHACDSAKTHACLGEDKVVFRPRYGGEVSFFFDKVSFFSGEVCVIFGEVCVRFGEGRVRFDEGRVRFDEGALIYRKVSFNFRESCFRYHESTLILVRYRSVLKRLELQKKQP